MPNDTKEVALIKGAREPVAKTQQALESGNMEVARQVWATYDPLWNAMEVYVSFRSKENYDDLEKNWQAKITEAFGSTTINPNDIIPMTNAMLATWDEALSLAETGPAISPLFDDVAEIREARQPLRAASAALGKGNIADAKAAFNQFSGSAWPQIQGLYQQHTPEAFQDLENAIAGANPVFDSSTSTVEELLSALQELNTKFGAGQVALTQVARES